MQWDNIFISGYRGKEKFHKKVALKPYHFIPGIWRESDTKFKTTDGKLVKKIDFNTARKARDFLESSKYDGNSKIYGSNYYDYVHIYDNYKNQKPDKSLIKVLNFDIETDSEGGYGKFTSEGITDREVISVTMKVVGSKDIFVLGLRGGYIPQEKELSEWNIKYINCETEEKLLKNFVRIWEKIDPDGLTGWNIEFFDIPYMIKRITAVLGESWAKKLSPFGKIRKREVMMFGKPNDVFDIIGITDLDYMKTYKKFSFKNEESYALNYISESQLGLRKLDYSEYKTLANFYKKNFNKFIDYNVIDVIRVEQLENKLKYLDQVFIMSYDNLVNFADTYTTLKMSDVIIHNFLMSRNEVVPASIEYNDDAFQIAGGYVKEPHIGKHKYLISFDFTSLYPHLIMTFNISPETLRGIFEPLKGGDSVDKILNGAMNEHVSGLVDKNLCISGRGNLFSKDFEGFMPSIMKSLFSKRAEYSAIEKENSVKLAEIEKEIAKRGIDNSLHSERDKIRNNITEFGGKSLSQKIVLNAFYGAIANPYFRWHKAEIAESITLSGQLALKYVIKDLNIYLNNIFKTKNEDYVIAGDTDSLFLNLENLIKMKYPSGATSEESTTLIEKFSIKIQDEIQKCLEDLYKNTNAYEKSLYMALESIGSGIWVAKKRYVLSLPSYKMVRYDPPMIKITGIDAVRSSTPAICREYIKKCIPLLIDGSDEEVKKYIEDCKIDFNTRKFAEIASPRGVNGLEKYASEKLIYEKGSPAQVRGSLLYNSLVKSKKLENTLTLINSGDKIRYCYMKLPNPLMENLIAAPDELPEELELEPYLDYVTQFEKTFNKPLEKLMNAAGINFSDNIDISQFLRS